MERGARSSVTSFGTNANDRDAVLCASHGFCSHAGFEKHYRLGSRSVLRCIKTFQTCSSPQDLLEYDLFCMMINHTNNVQFQNYFSTNFILFAKPPSSRAGSNRQISRRQLECEKTPIRFFQAGCPAKNTRGNRKL